MADWSLTRRRTRFNSRLNKRRRNEIKVKEEKRSGQKASSSHSGTVVSSVLTRHSVSVTDARLVPQFVLVSNWFWLFELQPHQRLFCLFNLQKLNTHFHSSVRLLLSSFSFHLHSFSYIFPSFLFSYSPENSLFWLLLTLLFLHFQSHDHSMWLIDWSIDSVTDLFICIYLLLFEYLVHFLKAAVRLYMLLLPHWRLLIWPGWSLGQRPLAWRPSCYRFPLLLLLLNKVEQLIWGEGVMSPFWRGDNIPTQYLQ